MSTTPQTPKPDNASNCFVRASKVGALPEKAQTPAIDGWINMYQHGDLTKRGWGTWPNVSAAIAAIRRYGINEGWVYLATIPLSEYCS